jgi:hypothetical protein
MGRYKGLNKGSGSYEIPTEIRLEVGSETTLAVKNIPAAFVRVLTNFVEDRTHFAAESWAFWFMYFMPILLQGRFQKEKYYVHACELVRIMKMTLQYTITEEERSEI